MNSLDKIKAYTENLRQIAKTMPIGNTGYDKVESVCDALDLACEALLGHREDCNYVAIGFCDKCGVSHNGEALNQIAEKLNQNKES